MPGTNVELSVNYVNFIPLVLYSENFFAFINKSWLTITHGVEKCVQSALILQTKVSDMLSTVLLYFWVQRNTQ